jgi:hypothetical protein
MDERPSKSIPTKKIHSLQSFSVSRVKTLRSRFIDIRNGSDVTLEPSGSLCILDSSQKMIFIADVVKPEELLAMEINNYLQHPLKNLSFLTAILSCAPRYILSCVNEVHLVNKSQIEERLDVLRVIKYEETVAMETTNDHNPGTALDVLFIIELSLTKFDQEKSVELLKQNPLCRYTTSEVVAWNDNGIFRYATILEKIRGKFDGISYYRVEVNKNKNVVDLPIGLIYKFKSGDIDKVPLTKQRLGTFLEELEKENSEVQQVSVQRLFNSLKHKKDNEKLLIILFHWADRRQISLNTNQKL